MSDGKETNGAPSVLPPPDQSEQKHEIVSASSSAASTSNVGSSAMPSIPPRECKFLPISSMLRGSLTSSASLAVQSKPRFVPRIKIPQNKKILEQLAACDPRALQAAGIDQREVWRMLARLAYPVIYYEHGDQDIKKYSYYLQQIMPDVETKEVDRITLWAKASLQPWTKGDRKSSAVASATGDSMSQVLYAHNFLAGEEAKQNYLMAARQDDAFAEWKLGKIMEEQKNSLAANYYYARAAGNGLGIATRTMGLQFHYKFRPRYFPMAENLYIAAEQQGVDTCQYRGSLAERYQLTSHDAKAAERCYRVAEKTSSAYILSCLGDSRHKAGQLSIALRYYRNAFFLETPGEKQNEIQTKINSQWRIFDFTAKYYLATMAPDEKNLLDLYTQDPAATLQLIRSDLAEENSSVAKFIYAKIRVFIQSDILVPAHKTQLDELLNKISIAHSAAIQVEAKDEVKDEKKSEVDAKEAKEAKIDISMVDAKEAKAVNARAEIIIPDVIKNLIGSQLSWNWKELERIAQYDREELAQWGIDLREVWARLVFLHEHNNGTITPPDAGRTKFKKYLQLLLNSSQDDSDQYVLLAKMWAYQYGIGKKYTQNEASAIACCQAAASKKNTLARYLLALFMFNGQIATATRDEACTQFFALADEGFAPAQNRCGEEIASEAPELAVFYYTQASIPDYPYSMKNLGDLFCESKNADCKQLGAEQYAFLTEQDSPLGWSSLGHYFLGEPRSNANLIEAERCMQKAFELGKNPKCIWNIGYIRQQQRRFDESSRYFRNCYILAGKNGFGGCSVDAAIERNVSLAENKSIAARYYLGIVNDKADEIIGVLRDNPDIFLTLVLKDLNDPDETIKDHIATFLIKLDLLESKEFKALRATLQVRAICSILSNYPCAQISAPNLEPGIEMVCMASADNESKQEAKRTNAFAM
ncbi:MAG: hypothetical protein M1561_03450 [Gammaproteobacteria bacterium]|nr:hypothetical protein [Gammaproteobacteria bacterium]